MASSYTSETERAREELAHRAAERALLDGLERSARHLQAVIERSA